MHTSKALESSHFEYWRIEPGTNICINFSVFCPDYHEQDRVAVVSPRLEDGILHTGYALLALTTAFYDVQRARSSDFFTYPQHFAVIAADPEGVATGAGPLDLDETSMGAAWSQLDVWPASNWITASGMPAEMLQVVFDFQINRLFWPQDFKAKQSVGLLPDYARKILKARLKSVCYYHTSSPTVEIWAAQAAADIIQGGIDRLPMVVRKALPQTQTLPKRASQDVDDCAIDRSPPSDLGLCTDARPHRQSYRQVSVDDFLEDMGACFKNTNSQLS